MGTLRPVEGPNKTLAMVTAIIEHDGHHEHDGPKIGFERSDTARVEK